MRVRHSTAFRGVLNLLAAFTVAFCSSEDPSGIEVDVDRHLALAWAGEVEVVIWVGTNRLAPSHGDWTASVAVVQTHPHHGGSQTNRVITQNPVVIQPDLLECCARNINLRDGIKWLDLSAGDGRIWNGVYTLTITRRNTSGTVISTCPYEVVQNHKDIDSDTFFDIMWNDQTLTLHYPTTGSGCPAAEWRSNHQKSSQPLNLQLTGIPPSVNVNQQFTVTASAPGGFGSPTFTSDFFAEGTTQVDFATSSNFSSQNSWVHSYPNPGTYIIAVAARSIGSTGGVYDLETRTITVNPVPIPDDAQSLGNSLSSDPTMCPSEVRWVTYTMKNIGTNTWTAPTYILALHHDMVWYPQSVSLPFSVGPGGTVWFSFYMYAPSSQGNFAAAYQMKKNSTFFGQQNNTNVLVTSNCYGALLTSPASTLAEDPANLDLSGKARDVLPLRLHVLPSDPALGYLNFSYATSQAEGVDLILRLDYDSSVLTPVAAQRTTTIQNLQVESGPGAAGSHWIRIRGELPAGSGKLVRVPFRILMSGQQEQWGTLTIFR